MNDEFKAVFERLQDEATKIHYTWSLYKELYANGDEVISLLNKYGSNLFLLIQKLLIENITLELSKLTDPHRQGSNENLSLKQIQVYADKAGHHDLLKTAKLLYDDIERKCQPFRVVRRKRIAHADFNHALKLSETPLPSISILDIDNTLAALSRYLNAIEHYYFGSETGYDLVKGPFGTGSDALIGALQMAAKYESSQTVRD